MSLTPQEVIELKSQLKSQISHLPTEQKSEALKQIDSMSPDALEAMLSQQNQKENIFRLIISNSVDSVKVGENSSALAVLDINPISQGHILIIPKFSVKTPKTIPPEAFNLSESLSKKITENLKAVSVRLETDVKFGEAIINLIPIYDKELTKNSPREKATTEDLKKIKTKLETIKPQKKEEKIKIEKKITKLKLPRRIA